MNSTPYPHEHMRSVLAAKIRNARLNRHLTQAALALEININSNNISLMEHGHVVYPKAEYRILQGLGLLNEAIELYQKLIEHYRDYQNLRAFFIKRQSYLSVEMRAKHD